MRAIKRVGMDEKVLVRLKNMLAAHEAEVKQNEADEKQAKKLKEEEEAKNIVVPEGTEQTDFETTSTTETPKETSMDAEDTDAKKKYKVSLRKMKNENNEYPAWMTTKKIRKHKNLMKHKEKRKQKDIKNGKKWKLANSF